ncbi:MAG: hypothetical protein CM15mP6_1210 [Methanobacteriota archaeon]|nr:MAG: hypothetical protein CM15mP6_1210 [Euryarchaeota archaeon]
MSEERLVRPLSLTMIGSKEEEGVQFSTEEEQGV